MFGITNRQLRKEQKYQRSYERAYRRTTALLTGIAAPILGRKLFKKENPVDYVTSVPVERKKIYAGRLWLFRQRAERLRALYAGL